MGLNEDIKQVWFKTEFHKSILNVYYTSKWLEDKYAPIFRSYNVTAPQFNVLRILRGRYPQPATVNLVIESMLDKSSNVSRLVDKLEEKGLVLRKQCTKDRRAVDVKISRRGLMLLDEMDIEVKDLHERITVLSEEEQKQLNYLLDKMREVKRVKVRPISKRVLDEQQN